MDAILNDISSVELKFKNYGNVIYIYNDYIG